MSTLPLQINGWTKVAPNEWRNDAFGLTAYVEEWPVCLVINARTRRAQRFAHISNVVARNAAAVLGSEKA